MLGELAGHKLVELSTRVDASTLQHNTMRINSKVKRSLWNLSFFFFFFFLPVSFVLAVRNEWTRFRLAADRTPFNSTAGSPRANHTGKFSW